MWPQGPQPAPEGENWEARFDALLNQARQVEKNALLRGAHLLEGILLDLAPLRAVSMAAPTREQWLDGVLDELNAGVFAPDYVKIAARCGVGLSTLRRRFKAATGLALHAYVLQNRLEAARQLLGESDLPLKAIAARLGYGDVYFFAAQFRRAMGVTPAAYRRSRQK